MKKILFILTSIFFSVSAFAAKSEIEGEWRFYGIAGRLRAGENALTIGEQNSISYHKKFASTATISREVKEIIEAGKPVSKVKVKVNFAFVTNDKDNRFSELKDMEFENLRQDDRIPTDEMMPKLPILRSDYARSNSGNDGAPWTEKHFKLVKIDNNTWMIQIGVSTGSRLESHHSDGRMKNEWIQHSNSYAVVGILAKQGLKNVPDPTAEQDIANVAFSQGKLSMLRYQFDLIGKYYVDDYRRATTNFEFSKYPDGLRCFISTPYDKYYQYRIIYDVAGSYSSFRYYKYGIGIDAIYNEYNSIGRKTGSATRKDDEMPPDIFRHNKTEFPNDILLREVNAYQYGTGEEPDDDDSDVVDPYDEDADVVDEELGKPVSEKTGKIHMFLLLDDDRMVEASLELQLDKTSVGLVGMTGVGLDNTLNVSIGGSELIDANRNGIPDSLEPNGTDVGSSLKIQQQPDRTKTLKVGETGTLTVITSGTSVPTYQWFKGGNAIAGATNSSFRITNATKEDAGSYFVFVQDANGNAAKSDNSVVNVVDNNGSGNGNDAGGTGGSGSGSGAGDNNGSGNGGGSGNNTGGTFWFSIEPPNEVIALEGGTAAMSLIVRGNTGTLKIEWYKKSSDGGGMGTKIAGATGTRLILTSLTLTDGGLYYAVATDTDRDGNLVGTPITSSTCLLSVLSLDSYSGTISIVTQPQSYIFAEGGDDVNFYVNAIGETPLTYQWYYDDGETISLLVDETNPFLMLENVQEDDSGSYVVVITDGSGARITSDETLLFVDGYFPSQNPSGISWEKDLPLSRSVKEGAKVNLSVKATATVGGGIEYVWTMNGVLVPGATSTLYAFTATTSQTGAVFTAYARVVGNKNWIPSSPLTLSVETEAGSGGGSDTDTDGAGIPSRLDGQISLSSLDLVEFRENPLEEFVLQVLGGNQSKNYATFSGTSAVIEVVEGSLATHSVALSDEVQNSAVVTWYRDGVPLNIETQFAEGTAYAEIAADGKLYSVSISTQRGTQVVTTFFSRLKVVKPARIVRQPVRFQYVSPSGSVTLRVAATGDGLLRYQWFKDGQYIPWAISASLTVSAADIGANGAISARYSCRVVNRAGLVAEGLSQEAVVEIR